VGFNPPVYGFDTGTRSHFKSFFAVPHYSGVIKSHPIRWFDRKERLSIPSNPISLFSIGP
jgi:hypothetical protein